MTRAERKALAGVVAIAPPDRKLAAATIVTGAVALLAGAALLALSGALISKASLRPPVLSLGVLIVCVRAVGLVRAIARYGERLTSHDLALRALGRLRSTFFARLVDTGARLTHGDLLARFVGDVDQLQALYLRALAPPATALVSGAVTVAVAAVLLPAAAAVLAAGLLVAGIAVPLIVAALARRSAQRQAGARARLSTHLLELARHADELAVAGHSTAAIERADRALRRIAIRDAVAGAAAGGLSTRVQGAAVVGVLAVSIPATGGGLDPILLAALAFLTLASFEATTPLAAAAQQLAACGSAAARLTAIVEQPANEPRVKHAGGNKLEVRAPLELRDVTLRRMPAAAPLLDRVDFTLRPAETVALTGPSGAGKTTLAQLLVRFAEPDTGAVLLGGTDVRRLDPHELRRTVRLIASDEALFTTTVAENVRLARPQATDEDVEAALAKAGLGGWLAALPDGLQTLLGEDGTTVSGGQRRRLALARAFLTDARFLIVDEPSEHLDPDAASALLATLAAHARERRQGLLAVVHGSDLQAFDRRLTLHSGRLIDTLAP